MTGEADSWEGIYDTVPEFVELDVPFLLEERRERSVASEGSAPIRKAA